MQNLFEHKSNNPQEEGKASKEFLAKKGQWTVSSTRNLRIIDFVPDLLAALKVQQEHAFFPSIGVQSADHDAGLAQLRRLSSAFESVFFVYGLRTGRVYDCNAFRLTTETTYQSRVEKLRDLISGARNELQDKGLAISLLTHLLNHTSPGPNFTELVREMQLYRPDLIHELILFMNSDLGDALAELPVVQNPDEIEDEVRTVQLRTYWSELWKIFDVAKGGMDDLEALSLFLNHAESVGEYAGRLSTLRQRPVEEMIEMLKNCRLFKFSTETHARRIDEEFPGKYLQDTDVIQSKTILVEYETIIQNSVGEDVEIALRFSLNIPLSMNGIRLLLANLHVQEDFETIESAIADKFIEIFSPTIRMYLGLLNGAHIDPRDPDVELPQVWLNHEEVERKLFAILDNRLLKNMLARTEGVQHLSTSAVVVKKVQQPLDPWYTKRFERVTTTVVD